MSEKRRNIQVAIFVILAMVALGWLVLQFGDLPAIFSKYDAHEITIYFQQAPGVQENTEVLFRGYPVGRVVKVLPPALLPDIDNPQQQHYQVTVSIAIGKEHAIPDNVIPKVYQRGLGGGFLALELPPGKVTQTVLTDGDKLKGELSLSSQFIPESTQKKFDKLVDSLIAVSTSLSQQFTPLPPEIADADSAVQPNITTAIIRLDSVLKNFDTFVGNPENQENFNKALADFATLSDEIRMTIKQTDKIADSVIELIDQVSITVTSMESVSADANKTFKDMGIKIQDAADQLAKALRSLDGVLSKVATGEGTFSKVLNDPRLYESFTDTVDNMNKTIKEFRELMEDLREQGIKLKL